MKRLICIPCLILIGAALLTNIGCIQREEEVTGNLSPKEELGKRIFFDPNLSSPPVQSCSSCHAPETGWTGPTSDVNNFGAVYEGALSGRFGNRKPPTAAYAGFSPKLHRDEEGTFVGGMFWDGRASGHILGDPLAEQAQGPFLNPLEQNLAVAKDVVTRVSESEYADLFREVWGEDVFDLDDDKIYEYIARSIAEFERSVEVNPFSSKFDDFWRQAKSKALNVEEIDEENWIQFRELGLSEDELKGLLLFNTTGKCADCHVLTSVDGNPPLFTDFTYDNLGVPKNPENPFYAMGVEWNPHQENWIDKGLGEFLAVSSEYSDYAVENIGKQKVPTLRNVDMKSSPDFIKAFMHNGFFTSLKEVVRFYNTRDKEGEEWPAPEVAENMNTDEMGDLGLSEVEEDLIVLFMQTLTDIR
ncbi:cytochrome-c peroxidase [Acidobacteriota bacterium]